MRNDNIEKELSKSLGINIPAYPIMRNAIQNWSDIYLNKSPWLNDNMNSLNLGATIASEISRLVCLEFSSKIVNEGEEVNEQYQFFLKNIRKYIEYACAQGGIVFKPYVENEKTYMCVVPQVQFFPISIDASGTITEAIFIEVQVQNGKYYTLVEHRKFMKDKEAIQYKLFEAWSQSTLGNEVALYTIDKWSNFQPTLTINNIDSPLFIYFKIPFANSIDLSAPLGVSIYSRAVDLIRNADNIYTQYLTEYELGQFCVFADSTAFVDIEKRKLSGFRERIYKVVDQIDLFREWAPQLRDDSIYAGINNILRRIEFSCGLSYNTLSDANTKELTATEIISSRQRSYGTIHEIQTVLEEVLTRVAKIFCILNKVNPKSLEVTFDWDDSIINDIDTQKHMFLEEIAAGVKFPWEYRVKFDGMTEEEAKKLLEENKADDGIRFEDEEDEEETEKDIDNAKS